MIRNRVRPSLEPLEDRWLPAVTVSDNVGVLLIIGDLGHSHVITISDKGTTTAGAITVTVDGGKPFASTDNVNQIRVKMHGLNDTINYNLTSTPSSGVVRVLNVNFANGNNNAFAANFQANLGSNDAFTINVRGGAGSARETVNAISTNVPSTSSLNISLNGGSAGGDILTMNYQGQMAGMFNLNMNGGAGGRDLMTGNLTFNSGSSGLLTAFLAGHGSLNSLNLVPVRSNPADTLGVDATIDGGPGINHARHTANVFITNITINEFVGGG
jgi:hypothetical protein